MRGLDKPRRNGYDFYSLQLIQFSHGANKSSDGMFSRTIQRSRRGSRKTGERRCYKNDPFLILL
jgi:hypothetical protein